jgi:two-component system LytT family sensor kinase
METMGETMATLPDLRRLTRIAIGYVLVWIAFALFGTSQAYRISLASGAVAPDWIEIFGNELHSALLWAMFTPIVVAVGERLSFHAHKWRDTLLLMLGVPLLASGRLLFGAAVVALEDGQALELSTLTRTFAGRFHGHVFQMLAIIAVTRLVCAWNESRRREIHAAELTATLTRARIDELRRRLQPDFLMQSLQTIGRRIRAGDPSSEALIVGLSDFLRQVLLLARQNRTTLEEQLDLLDRYILFCELLSGRSIESRYEFDELLLGADVPLMIVQPLLHEAIDGAHAGPLRITLRGRLEGDVLKLEVEDDAGTSPRTELARVRERVKHFLAEARFGAETRGVVHTTWIDLPLPAEAAP